jgi:hypothetical protein
MKKTITKADLVEAIRKNGVPQTKGTLIRYSINEGVSACAMGQAGINLGIDPNKLESLLYENQVIVPTQGFLHVWIEFLNDDAMLTYEQIADRVEEEAPDFSVEYVGPEFNLDKYISRYSRFFSREVDKSGG